MLSKELAFHLYHFKKKKQKRKTKTCLLRPNDTVLIVEKKICHLPKKTNVNRLGGFVCKTNIVFFFSLRNKTDNSVCDFCTLLSHFLLFWSPIFRFESRVTNLTIYPLGTQADSNSPHEERSHQPPHPILAGGQFPQKAATHDHCPVRVGASQRRQNHLSFSCDRTSPNSSWSSSL